MASDPVPVVAMSPEASDVAAEVASFVRRLFTLHDVVIASLALDPPRLVAEVVVQDEYTHDVVVPWRTNDQERWLVYDTT